MTATGRCCGVGQFCFGEVARLFSAIFVIRDLRCSLLGMASTTCESTSPRFRGLRANAGRRWAGTLEFVIVSP